MHDMRPQDRLVVSELDKALVLAKRAAVYARRLRVAATTGLETHMLERLANEAMRACGASARVYDTLAVADRAEFDRRWPTVFASIAS